MHGTWVHGWFSGRILACHAGDPGLLPGPCSHSVPFVGFPGSSDSEEFASSAGDLGLILGLGRSPGEGNGNSPQYFCLENSMDKGAWWATVHGVAKSPTRLSD